MSQEKDPRSNCTIQRRYQDREEKEEEESYLTRGLVDLTPYRYLPSRYLTSEDQPNILGHLT
jgi:hypothetical protein